MSQPCVTRVRATIYHRLAFVGWYMAASVGCSVFTDESATRERFLCYGGVFLPTGLMDEAERLLEEYATKNGFVGQEMSWKKCSRGQEKRYGDFAALLWNINASVCCIDFRSLVVDTKKYPLVDPSFDCNTEEEGFYKFYHHFITRSVTLVASDADEYELWVASLSDQYPYRTEILNATIAGTLKKMLGAEVKVHQIKRTSPKEYRLHQLADVLLGAVSFKFNRNDDTARKRSLCGLIEAKVGQSLDSDFVPGQRPFNVWQFVSKAHLDR